MIASPAPPRSTAPSAMPPARGASAQPRGAARRRALGRLGALGRRRRAARLRRSSSRRAALDAVHAFMTDGAGSPLYGGDPAAARLGAEALRARIAAGEATPRATRRCRDLKLLNLLSPPPSGRRPPAPPASTMGA